MSTPQPRYSKEEFAQCGDDIFERLIRPRLKAEDEGKFVVIDIETGAYEIDTDEIAASDRRLASHPNAQIWLRRVGSRYVRRFGPRAGGGDTLTLRMAMKVHSTSTKGQRFGTMNHAASQSTKLMWCRSSAFAMS